MPLNNYYEENKYCPQCDDYVRFLQSLAESYCVECGGKVSLFSKKDKQSFMRSLNAAKQSPRSKKQTKRVS